MTPALRAAWTALARAVGADPELAAADGRRLAARYGAPGRAYHTLGHVADVLATVERLAAVERVDDLWTVRAAAWFHDAVYDAAAADNEEASARLATGVLAGWGVAAGRRAQVAALVRATATHAVDAPGGTHPADAAVLVDADLAVLAADAPRYAAYTHAIRAEYAHLDDATFRAGRQAFVEAMLARERIFATATMARSAERAARRNLAAELAELDAGGP